jgi:hypothetical protein
MVCVRARGPSLGTVTDEDSVVDGVNAPGKLVEDAVTQGEIRKKRAERTARALT